MDLHRTIEAIFAGMKWRQLGIALLFVLLYVAVIDRVVGSSLPEPGDAADDQAAVLWPMGLPRNDPRAFFDPPPSPPGTYRLALVTSSSGVVFKSNYVQDTPLPTTPTTDLYCGYSYSEILEKRLPTVNGEPLKIYHYLQNGGRLEDFVMSIRHALSEVQPDALLVGINPILLGNDSLLFRIDAGKRKWNSEFLQPPFADRFEASLAFRRPAFSDVEFALSSHLVGLSSSRGAASDVLAKRISAIVSPVLPAQPRKTICKRGDEPRKRSIQTSVSLAKRYLKLRQEDASFASAYMESALKHLASSGVPVYVFLEPFNPKVLEDPSISAVIEERYRQLAAVVSSLHADNIRLDPDTLNLYADPENFTDYIHTINGDLLADHLARVTLEQAASAPRTLTKH
jgi:hypothetical protein